MMTPRQAEIAALVCTGASNKQIAGQLGICEGTVKQHLHTLYEELGLSGRAQLFFYLQTTER